jgi:hypothetical protein
MSSNKKAAIDVAKERSDGLEVTVDLPYGVKGIIVPVPPQLVDEVTNRIQDPEVPIWHNEEKDRDEPNPSDPDYLKALEEANRARGVAAIDTMALFGIDIETMPESDAWLKKLQYMQKRDLIDISGYDLEDDQEREFVFKRFIAVNNIILKKIMAVSGITEEEVAAAERSFRGDEEG